MEVLLSNIFFIGKGIIITLQLLLGGIAVGMVLGLSAAIIRYQKKIVSLINIMISIIRGTPLILQLAFVYFVIPELLSIKLSMMTAGIITFGLNSAAYVAEILRAGIENIPKGQFEAAQTLNISTYAMWKDIILPQVMRNILPAIISELITLLKETALIATIGGMDLMRSAQTIAAEQFVYFMPLCIAGAYYYVMVLIFEYCGKLIERKWAYVKN